MDNIYTIYKNPRYKIIQKGNRYLMVDLEQNWYSYLCPMLNWLIPIKFTELTYQEFNNINIFHNGGQKSQGMLAGGIGVTISVLLRSLVGYMDINISQIWLVIMFLLGFVAVIALRLSISKKLNHPAFNQNSTQKVMLIPSFKNMILVVFCYFMFLFFSIAPIQMIFDDNQNIFGYIGWLVTLFLFTIMNIVSISDRKVHVKTKNIGRQAK
ncbi:DUF443 family protein [Staphylococcus epidermidis]|uniref:DUF443 family protein n=1 Tax=Staphylococcus epidermidis TaxID=1282 RepID=UPI00138AB0F0|nr:DUF443 family protein [Staphylococcus epidermidis]MCD8923186.1 DUF443 domain-containing protein [Staphylococcus epidermidis]MCD9057641.1 DUF443 domain-containing protein [Staphylococcus epidermidis]MEB5736133.1 DUF443 domain-containing protein [Staphylococcus epidermidis]MEB7070650.1 DUF443 domain-containing protein [Staphylococcus epidermidis]MEB7386295.1 DUF443 domain-containing protein [Staphylococcus epidermidis]